MKNILLTICIGLFASQAHAQLLINEVSQGASGTAEYIELLVAGTRTCTDSTMDLRGFILDDNAGWYGSHAFNAGCFRFSSSPSWSAVPYGALILIYNNADKNASIKLADYETDADGDYVYVVPGNSGYLEYNATDPALSNSAFDYSTALAGSWSTPGTNDFATALSMDDAADVLVVINPSTATNAAAYALGWDSAANSTMTIPSVQLLGIKGFDYNLYNTGSAHMNSSWAIGSAGVSGTNNETPGAANTLLNSAWIASMRQQTSILHAAINGAPGICAGSSQTYSLSPAIPGAGYSWSLPQGWSGTGAGSTINLSAGNSGGFITVSHTDACGNVYTTNQLVLVETPPARPGIITGSSLVCIGSKQTYTISPVAGAISYNWKLPHSWTGNSQDTSIQVMAGNPGQIMVEAINACGASLPGSLNATTLAAPPLPAFAASSTICAGSSVTYMVMNAGADTCVWSLPAGWIGTPSGGNAIQCAVGTSGGTITVALSNLCGTGPSVSMPVAVQPFVTPALGITTPNTTICSAKPAVFYAHSVHGGLQPGYQ